MLDSATVMGAFETLIRYFASEADVVGLMLENRAQRERYTEDYLARTQAVYQRLGNELLTQKDFFEEDGFFADRN
jgi:hypothetical protein